MFVCIGLAALSIHSQNVLMKNQFFGLNVVFSLLDSHFFLAENVANSLRDLFIFRAEHARPLTVRNNF